MPAAVTSANTTVCHRRFPIGPLLHRQSPAHRMTDLAVKGLPPSLSAVNVGTNEPILPFTYVHHPSRKGSCSSPCGLLLSQAGERIGGPLADQQPGAASRGLSAHSASKPGSSLRHQGPRFTRRA